MSNMACSSADPGSRSVTLVSSQKACGRTGLHTFGFGSALHSIYTSINKKTEMMPNLKDALLVAGILAKAVGA